MSTYYIFALGFLAQALFSARLLHQWLASERAKSVQSPTLFWQLSLLASFLLMLYGILRHDLAIILGQFLSYFIYIRNLKLKQAWQQFPYFIRTLALLFPLIALLWLLLGSTYSFQYIWQNNEVPITWLMWGSIAQMIFTFRFVYQWYYSEKAKASILPLGFWNISLIGSSMILSYAIYRHDPVLFVGQLFGFTIYIRNIFLHLNKAIQT